jgi:dTDP-4-amino-4,6-dideoxygalactose transaminase
VDKYTWVDVGSSFLPGEVTAAFLAAQTDAAQEITARRLALWDRYNAWAAPHEARGALRRPIVPAHCSHNAHMYYILLPSLTQRTAFIAGMKERGVGTVFHYVPLHSAPAGQRYARAHGGMEVTDDISSRLVRMPLWAGLEEHMDTVLEAADEVLANLG